MRAKNLARARGAQAFSRARAQRARARTDFQVARAREARKISCAHARKTNFFPGKIRVLIYNFIPENKLFYVPKLSTI